jgi:hypothetical protein
MMNVDMLTLSRYLKIHDWCKNKNINIEPSLFPNQISSKLWLITELKKLVKKDSSLNVDIVGSWYGWPLTGFLFENFKINTVNLYDIDAEACLVAKMYSRIFQVENKVNIINKNYWSTLNNKENINLVINCSSEHMKETFSDYDVFKKDCIFIIQSNNYFKESTHINCCIDSADLIKKHKITSVMYSGSMDFNDLNEKKQYKRYMVMGKLN